MKVLSASSKEGLDDDYDDDDDDDDDDDACGELKFLGAGGFNTLSLL